MKSKNIRNAVSIIFVFEDKIFSIIRQNFLRAFPGYTAFPGGKVDKKDESSIDPLLAAARREMIEELSFDIESESVVEIRKIGRALTPKFNPYRFNTHFYRVELKEKPVFKVDENEAKSFAWMTPKELISSFDSGDRLMVPPVRYFIEEFCLDMNFKKELVFENRFDLSVEVPMIEPIKNFIQVMPRSLTVPPADRTNAFLIGNMEKVLIDPSPMDEDELTKFLNTISKYKISKILITHHHPDHHKFVTKIAKFLDVDIYLSQFTHTRCLKVYGENYFEKVSCKFIKEGDFLTEWLDERVVAVEVPGHDEGQIALMPISKKWFIAGDLFQGVGTVVVGGEEGDMATYFKTLSKVIKLDPSCVVPSHGIALGGTNILKKTLEHRKHREEQILEMYNKGISVEQMLAQIYFSVPEKVLKYARANIESHLNKLKDENKII